MLRDPADVGRHLVGMTLCYHAPTDPRVGVPAIHLEGDRSLRHFNQLGARARAKDDDSTFDAVVDRKDLDPTVDGEGDSAHVA
jgi:hypothetical protein